MMYTQAWSERNLESLKQGHSYRQREALLYYLLTSTKLTLMITNNDANNDAVDMPSMQSCTCTWPWSSLISEVDPV